MWGKQSIDRYDLKKKYLKNRKHRNMRKDNKKIE